MRSVIGDDDYTNFEYQVVRRNVCAMHELRSMFVGSGLRMHVRVCVCVRT